MAAIRMLAYEILTNAMDKYCQLEESTTIESMKRFVIVVRACFESVYLWKPSRDDVVKQMAINP
jgi:hypothetical protein